MNRVVTLRLSDEELETVQTVCQERGCSRNELFRWMVSRLGHDDPVEAELIAIGARLDHLERLLTDGRALDPAVASASAPDAMADQDAQQALDRMLNW